MKSTKRGRDGRDVLLAGDTLRTRRLEGGLSRSSNVTERPGVISFTKTRCFAGLTAFQSPRRYSSACRGVFIVRVGLTTSELCEPRTWAPLWIFCRRQSKHLLNIELDVPANKETIRA